MIVKAQAKVNMALEVVGQMENGYHELDMIMAPVSIFDTIEILESSKDLVTCEGYEIPEVNTVSRMISLLKKLYGFTTCYHVHMKKDIPMQSGMAGGSADAAAVMKAILEMEHIEIPLETQLEIGKQIGADVPFCIFNKWARVQGIGEIITGCDTDLKIKALIIKPDEGVSTPEAFQYWHAHDPLRVDVSGCQKAIEDKAVSTLLKIMDNSLEPAAKSLVPVLNVIKEEMVSCGIDRVMMSGSGSSMMGFAKDSVLEYAKSKLEHKYPFVRIVTIG